MKAKTTVVTTDDILISIINISMLINDIINNVMSLSIMLIFN